MQWQATIAAMAAAAFLSACGEMPGSRPGEAATVRSGHCEDGRWLAGAPQASLPADLASLSVEARKAVFLDSVLPAVHAANSEVMCEREALESALQARDDPEAQAVFARLAERYGSDDPAILLRRVDTVPTGLALAQAAIESGWGTSRFARHGNALFGLQTRGGDGLKARESDATVFAFEDLHDAVRAYARTLNTHAAYREFRLRRAEARGEAADSCALARTLTRYSARGDAYGEDLCLLIRANDLDALRPSSTEVAATAPTG